MNSAMHERGLQLLDKPEIIAQEIADIPNDLKHYKRTDRLMKIRHMFFGVDAETQQAMLDRVQELYDLYQFRKAHEGDGEP